MHKELIIAFLKNLSIIVIFLAFSQSLKGQKITGKVIDENQEGIPYAEVELIKSQDTLQKITNFYGEFSIKELKPDQYTLIIKYINYSTLDTTIDIGQESSDFTFKLRDTTNIDSFCIGFGKSRAIDDIKNGNAKLILPGGLVGSTIKEKDTIFENKYGVQYYDPGCVKYGNYKAYNEEIFEYLNKQFGKEWKQEVRKDVVGLGMD